MGGAAMTMAQNWAKKWGIKKWGHNTIFKEWARSGDTILISIKDGTSARMGKEMGTKK